MNSINITNKNMVQANALMLMLINHFIPILISVGLLKGKTSMLYQNFIGQDYSPQKNDRQ